MSEAINICLSADGSYAPYLGVTIQSIKANKSELDRYNVYILDGGISNVHKNKILKMVDNYFSINFINIKEYLTNIDKKIFFERIHFSIATYFRFFIPQIFPDHNKILYLDCDLIVNTDIAKLYHTNLDGFAIAASKDIEICRRTTNLMRQYNETCTYLRETLKMKNIEMYFQAGVLLLDVQKLKSIDFTSKCIEKLKEIKRPQLVDQDIMNSLFDGNYKNINMEWNVLWGIPYKEKNLDKQLPKEIYNEYFLAREKAYIVHYASDLKPWKNPDIELADIWWQYARQTPFYEEIIYNNTKMQIMLIASNKAKEVLNTIFTYNKNKLLYYRYKLLSKITFGKMRKHYKKKRKELKTKLKEVKQITQGKK